MHLVNGNYVYYILGSRTLNFSVMSLLLMQRLCQYALDQYMSNCLLFSNHISKRALDHGEKFCNLQKNNKYCCCCLAVKHSNVVMILIKVSVY